MTNTLVPPHIKTIAMHEIDEFLKIDGKHVRDPHPELQPLRTEPAFVKPLRPTGGCG